VEDDGRPSQAAQAVFLLGMHRSGTSTLVNFLSDLGLKGPKDPLPAAPDNPDGYGESLAIINANNALLEARSGAWDAPPPAFSPESQDVERAQTAFLTAYPKVGNQPLVVKDPRLCVLMSTWRAALGGALKAIVLFRHPDRVVASLLNHNRGESQLNSSLHANALWERYNRALLEGLRDDDEVLLCDFDALLDDESYRSTWLGHLVSFLPQGLGLDHASASKAFAERFSLAATIGASPDSVMTPQQHVLYQELKAMAETNVVKPLMGSETPGHDALFGFVAAAKITLPAVETQLADTQKALEEQTEARQYVEGYSANQQLRIEALDDQLARMEETLSWRVTEPLRKIQQRRRQSS